MKLDDLDNIEEKRGGSNNKRSFEMKMRLFNFFSVYLKINALYHPKDGNMILPHSFTFT